MKRTIYHGSAKVIEAPFFGGGKKHNDYGKGFYCTQVSDMAREWAVSGGRDGFVSTYQIDEKGLRILDLGGKDYCILHWLTLLLENRHFNVQLALAQEAKEYLIDQFHLPVDQYDIIIGYRADDSYFSFAQDFISGAISVRQLRQAMHLGKLGEQYVIRSRTAFERLAFKGFEPVDHKEWFIKRQQRDRTARQEYYDLSRHKRLPQDLYMIQIIDQQIGAEDARLRSDIS